MPVLHLTPRPWLSLLIATSAFAARPTTTDNDDKDFLPQDMFDEVSSGWLYLNLDDGNDDDGRGAHQNWVTVTMGAQGVYAVTYDAAWLGNGCSPAADVTEFSVGHSRAMPGPAEDINP